jgi:hypothetical protein
MIHLGSRHWVDLQIATGILMVCQRISNLLDKTTRTSCRGWFFDRRSGPSPWAIAAIARPIYWRSFNRRVSA